MRTHRPTSLDDGTADRMIGGRVDSADAPPGYAPVAALLGAARSLRPGADVDAAEDLVPAMVRAIAANPNRSRKVAMLRRQLPARLAALAAAGVLTTAGAAAAATGNLPDRAQDVVADVAGAVGIDLPDGGDARPTGTADNPTDADAHGDEVSEVARTTDATGREHGEEVSTVARADHGPDATDDADDADDAGAPDEATDDDAGSPAPVETPNPGGIGTAVTASGGANQNGAAHADDHATLGSANAGEHPTAATARRPRITPAPTTTPRPTTPRPQPVNR